MALAHSIRWPGKSSQQAREARAGLLFVLPWLLFLLIFTAYPVSGTLFLSLTNFNVVETPQWVGLENYRRMFNEDPAFWTAVWNSTYYAALSVPLRLVLALALALILNLGVSRLNISMKTITAAIGGTSAGR